MFLFIQVMEGLIGVQKDQVGGQIKFFFPSPSGTPKTISGHCHLVITAFLEEHASFFLEEELIPMESEQIDLNIERTSQKHVNPDIKKLMVNVSNSPTWIRIFTLQRT